MTEAVKESEGIFSYTVYKMWYFDPVYNLPKCGDFQKFKHPEMDLNIIGNPYSILQLGEDGQLGIKDWYGHVFTTKKELLDKMINDKEALTKYKEDKNKLGGKHGND